MTSRGEVDLVFNDTFDLEPLSSNMHRRRTSPSPRHGRSRSPFLGYGSTRSPSLRYGRSRSPSSRYGRSRSPYSRYGRSRSPSSRHGRSRSPYSMRERSRSPSLRLGRSRSDSRRGENDQSSAPVENLVKALLAGGLSQAMEQIAKQQAALVVGDSAIPGPSSYTSGELDGRNTLKMVFEMIARFDPDDPMANIDEWLLRIDQLGDNYGLSSNERSLIVQSKLEGAAKWWLQQFGNLDINWDEWKIKLKTTFPGRRDFAVMLEEMVTRKKLMDETLTTYFHSKLDLCNRVNVTGEYAVSCIIRGLPDNLRATAQAANCGNPDTLFKFLSDLESHEQAKNPVVGDSQEKKKPALKRCYNCQKLTTHFSKDCPEPRMIVCRICGQQGHRQVDCRMRPDGTFDMERKVRIKRPSKKARLQNNLVRGPKYRK